MNGPRASVLYILDENNNLVPVDDWIEHCKWMYSGGENEALNPRARIGDTHYDDVRVSTVFLGAQTAEGIHTNRPMVFETLIIGGIFNGRGRRYASYHEAVAGHEAVCRRVFGGLRN